MKLKIEEAVDGFFISRNPFDDNGFVSNARVQRAIDMCEFLELDPPDDIVIAAIIASVLREDGIE
jgi:hypothetical protein